jgi:Zn-dependent protease with chaperone function
VLQPELAAPTRFSGARQTLSLVLLVAEGYVYLIGTITIFGAVVAILAWGLLAREPVVGLLALFLGAPTVLLTGAALRSLVLSMPKPKGVSLTSAAAPDMIEMVEELRREVGCGALDVVLVVPACNASAFHAGGLWRRRNVLLIGYPLLVVLSPDQLKAVVAHELAHFANGHSRLAGLVYRTRASWVRLAQVLNERGTMPIFVR